MDRPGIELPGMSKRVVARPMFLQMRIMMMLAMTEYTIRAAFDVN